MKKVNLFLFLVCVLHLTVRAEEMSLLRIAGKTVSMAEFNHYYRQSNQVQGDDTQTFFQNFLHYKLKVADAIARQMDTLPDFRNQCEALQTSVLKDFFIDEQLADSYYRSWYAQQSRRLSSNEWVKVEILTFRLSQHPTKKDSDDAVRVMDSLYALLKNRQVPYGEVPKLISDNRVCCDNEGKEWVPVNSLVQEVVDCQQTLAPGTYSAPIYSPLGIHIIRLIERKASQSWEEALPDMQSYMSRLGDSSPALKRDIYKQWSEGKLVIPESVNLKLKQVYDGLLAIYWDKTFLFSALSSDVRELESFFQANKARYHWEYPHFKGAVIHCANKKIASKIKKRLKKLPVALWEEALKRMEKEDAAFHTERECGLFQIGKNRYVDRLAFKCGNFEPMADLPYTFIVGKRLKKGPEELRDVQSLVETDYRIQKEKEVFDALSSRFQVEINQDVLKSVNSCGNN